MTDQRERFEQWILSVNANDGHTIERIEPGEYRSAATDCAWEAWQAAIAAAEADKWAAVRRCFEIVRQWEYSATYISDAIKAEFPEAWK